MYRVAICEDDVKQLEYLNICIEKILKKINAFYEILLFKSGEDLIKNGIDNIDIFLLDIQMSGLSGMDIAKILRDNDNDSEIIFITGIVDYIQEGYKVRAYRYLLKPINFEELEENFLSCIEDISKKSNKFILLKNKNEMSRVLIKDITYIEVIIRDIIIHTVYDKSYSMKNSMDNIENSLKKYNFFRCHRSYLINIDYIETIQKNEVIIKGKKIPVSKYRINDLKEKLAKNLGSILF